MSINVGDNFSYLGKKFLDARQSFDTLEAMRLCSDVPVGFITFCKEDNKRYEYGPNGWIEYAAGISEEHLQKIDAAYEHSQTEHVQASDLEGLATEEFVTNKIAEAKLDGEEVDLSGYVTKTDLESKGYLTEVPDEFVTNEELEAKGYLTEHQDLSDYVTNENLESKGYLTEVPDEFVTNEELEAKGYLTEHQDLSDYATIEYVDNAISGIEGGNVDLSNYVTKTELENKNYATIEYVDESLANFEGGGGATAPYISTTLPENSILGMGETFEMLIDFSSAAMGRGTLKLFINDKEVLNTSVNQGENIIRMDDTNFSKGNNRLTAYVIDRTGVMSNSLTFYVRYGSLEIASDFDAYTAYDYGSLVRYYFTPTAVDTSLTLTMYMSIDGEVKPGVSCTSDTRGYFTFPNNLEVGAHYCEAYVRDSAGNTSNILTFNLVIIDDVSLVIASDTQSVTTEEGNQLVLDYKVYMKNNTSFITKTYVDNMLVNTGTCTLDISYYRTSSLTEGNHTVRLEVYDVTETVSDYIIWNINITPSTYTMLEPVKTGALFIATAQNMTNSSENKEIWAGVDQDGTPVNGILSGFAFNSENGWVNDELLITGTSSVEIPIAPLANNARYGFTLDIEFASKAIGVQDALVLDLWNTEKDCGIKITTEKLILRSAEGNECDLYFTDDEITSVIFVIDRNEKTAKIYLNGVMCSAFFLSDYVIEGVPYLEDFTVNSNIKIGGRGHARVKNLRVYQIALTTDEILNNFMANEKNKAAQKALVEFQKGNDLPTLTVYCDFSGLGKDDKKPCRITYVSTNEEKYGKSFTLEHNKSTLQYQGTSSMAYPIKNYRLNLADENGDKWRYEFPYGKPEYRYTLKADFMSSGHWTNTGLTKWINENLYNYDITDEKSMNPKKWYDINNGGSLDDTRECIYGFPCRLILVNDGNTPLNEGQNEPTPGNTKDMGIFNFNHDKDATDTMGFDDDAFPNCASYEVTANSDTSAGAFMSLVQRIPCGTTSACIDISSFGGTLTLGYRDVHGTNTSSHYAQYLYMIDAEFKQISYMHEPTNKNPIVLADNTKYIRVSSNVYPLSNIIINGSYFEFERVDNFNNSMVYDPSNAVSELDYIKQSFEMRFPDEEDVPEGWGFMGIPGEEGTGLKALIDWVDKCSDEEFVRDFEQHFHKDYTLRYYLLVITLGMVDNLGKNMMFDTWDNKIFMPRFYDCDTICSYDNSGQLKFDVDIEMAQGYWNTSSSRLWTRIRDLFHDELIAKYNNMRQNGLSYESLMQCFYDEQIAKIPQKYYNMDYDVKYAPFADSYIGMANGDVYEHVKRWLKQRITFVDTLFDYAPSYNNDVLTIRANTTEPMTLYIETYTPVYQHLSWYNGQMDKKKIDGKIAVSFTGTAMAATDQEVLIYGGTNIKSIRGISSMNPNRMLIGSATRLIELEAPNCPLLADINSNKANLAPHTYLNKLDLSNCPLLGGNLIVNNSPLVREIDIRGTAITGLNLPSNLRNLEVLKLPAAITSLNLNDAGQLHTLTFENGARLQSISMTNCNALVNVENFDIRNASSVTLNNSYSSIQELYFKDTTNVSLSNMPNIEKIVYTPNDEYATFDRNYLTTKPDYKISVFNAPKCNTFMITAPHRTSYDIENEGEVVYQGKRRTVLDCIKSTGSQYIATDYYINGNTKIVIDLQMKANRQYDYWFGSDICNAQFDAIDGGHVALKYLSMQPNSDYTTRRTWTFTPTENVTSTLPLHIFGGYYMGALETNYLGSGTLYSFKIYENNVLVRDYEPCKDGNGVVCLYDKISEEFTYAQGTLTAGNVVEYLEGGYVTIKDYGEIKPDTVFAANSIDISNTRFTDVKLLSTTDVNQLKLPSTVTNLIIDSAYDIDTNAVTDAVYEYIHEDLYEAYNTDYEDEIKIFTSSRIDLEVNDEFASNTISGSRVNPDNPNQMASHSSWRRTDYISVAENSPLTISINRTATHVAGIAYYNGSKTALQYTTINNSCTQLIPSGAAYCIFSWRGDICSNVYIELNSAYTPDIVPSSSDGSIIYRINSDEDGVWNMDGMIMDNLHVFGVNNDVKLVGNSLTMPNRVDDYDYVIENFVSPNTVAIYTASNNNTWPAFNSGFTYTSMVDQVNGVWKYMILADNINNLPTSISFQNITTLTSVEYLKLNNVTDMSNMFNGCTGLTTVDAAGWNTSKVTTINFLFNGCINLTSVNVSGWNTTNVTRMANAFCRCSRLSSLDLSSWDTRNVTSMSSMFLECNALTTLNVANWNTIKVSDMISMFRACTSLTDLNVSNWDTSSLTGMSLIFNGCANLAELDLSKWKVDKVSIMSGIFQNCSRLTSLDLSGWDTKNVTNMDSMFDMCGAVVDIEPPINLYISHSISPLTALSREEIVQWLNALSITTTNPTITIGNTLLSKLSETDIAIAANKGWNVA